MGYSNDLRVRVIQMVEGGAALAPCISIHRRPCGVLTLLQHWSGAVTCPACLCGADGRWP
jgi:hypothetical protein